MRRPATLAITVALVFGACSDSTDTVATTQPDPADPADPAATELPHLLQLHDHRYCEVLVAVRDRRDITALVYNTIDHDQGCPQALWEELDPDVIAAEWDAEAVTLNGPRHLVMDEILGHQPASGQFETFGGIDMELRATIETRVREAQPGEDLYRDNEVTRDTTYVYHRGRTVHELLSPDGHTYIMQSYSQLVDPELTVDDLDRLGPRLRLPEGWSYRTRTLGDELTVSSNGLGYVLQDDFLNSYQRITP